MMNMIRKTAVLLTVLLLIAMAAPAAFAASNREVDTAKLQELMTVAQRLNPEQYTAQSWSVLAGAMEEANSAMESGKQNQVDRAARQVATALSQMIPMDFTKLNTALAAVDTWSGSNETVDVLWDQLAALVRQEQAARASGDQAAVDKLAADIDRTLAQLKAATGGTGSENSTPWIILFGVSLVLNAGLLVLMLLRTRTVKKCQKDDVPLVEYDIDDDLE